MPARARRREQAPCVRKRWLAPCMKRRSTQPAPCTGRRCMRKARKVRPVTTRRFAAERPSRAPPRGETAVRDAGTTRRPSRVARDSQSERVYRAQARCMRAAERRRAVACSRFAPERAARRAERPWLGRCYYGEPEHGARRAPVQRGWHERLRVAARAGSRRRGRTPRRPSVRGVLHVLDGSGQWKLERHRVVGS